MALVYFKLLENEKDPKSVKIYATSLLKLQDAYKDYSYTPFSEFALIDAYRTTKDYLKALETLDKLFKPQAFFRKITKKPYTCNPAYWI